MNQTRAPLAILRGFAGQIALLLTAYLSVALFHLGVDKFYYVLAGGQKFATFPDLPTQLGIGASYLFLSVLYLFWLARLLKSSSFYGPWRFRDVLRNTTAFWLLAFISYPLGNDVYLYLHSGLMNLSQVNPFITRAAAFSSELLPYVDWGQTSTYGPVSQLLFTVSASFVLAHPMIAVYVYKAFCLALHLLNGYLLWRWLPATDRGKITTAYLLHPLLLMEQVGSAHVDVLISTSLLLFALSFAKQRYWTAFAALWGGFLSKTLPIIWAPLVAIALLRQRRWGVLLSFILASGVIVGVLSFTVLPNVAAWTSLLNPGVSGQNQASLHAIVRAGLEILQNLAPDRVTPALRREILVTFTNGTLFVFFGFYAWRLWRSDRQWNFMPQTVIEEMGWVTLVLMLFATPWLMPWYCSIPLTFAALVPRARLFGLTSLAFGLSSSAQYVLFGSNFKSIVSVGLPILTLIVGAVLLKLKSSKSVQNESSVQDGVIYSIEGSQPESQQVGILNSSKD